MSKIQIIQNYCTENQITYETIDDNPCINGYISMSIFASTLYDRNNFVIEIKNKEQVLMGWIYLSLPTDIQENQFPEQLEALLIYDNQKMQPRLSCDYLVLKKEFYNEYKANYYGSAPLWGSFFHLNEHILQPKSISKTEIKAIPNLSLSQTEYHPEAVIRAIQQPFVFERFLKKYHLLELLFDYQLAKDIQNLSIQTELKEIIALTQSYKKEDIERLKTIVKKHCLNTDTFVPYLNLLRNFKKQTEGIFFLHEKSSNPVKEEFAAFFAFIDKENSFELDEIKKLNKTITQINVAEDNQKYLEQQANQLKSYQKFLLDFATYCIYRIRSSVAHHKVGEYLMTNDDEDFMLQFAEPLLDTVLVQCFQNQP
ncbi:MAG: hypothetical protein ACKVTZ_16085 [Bacteroidia bacterium]